METRSLSSQDYITVGFRGNLAYYKSSIQIDQVSVILCALLQFFVRKLQVELPTPFLPNSAFV